MDKNNALIKVDWAENWAKAKNYIPDKFTIIVYQYKDSSPKVKTGDVEVVSAVTVNSTLLPIHLKQAHIHTTLRWQNNLIFIYKNWGFFRGKFPLFLIV